MRAPLLALALLLASLPVFGQSAVSEPRREQLLNGLQMMLVSRSGDQDVLLKLRLHSGAAFDLAGKEGLMALLGDMLFEPETRQYVREDLDGRLDVTTNYDSINITLAGRATDFDRLVDLLRNAVTNTQSTSEAFERARAARVKLVREINLSPETVADRAISARLFGSYPYGRIVDGTPETLGRIDRNDLLTARERFLNPNNATLVVIGGIDNTRARRVLKQALGGWRKSDRMVPGTFRQPELPDARTLIIGVPDLPGTELRLAVRGFGRSDRDAAAANVLAQIVRDRWVTTFAPLKDRAVSVTHEAFAQSGIFRLSASVASAADAALAVESARKVLAALVSAPPTPAEFELARRTGAASAREAVRTDEAVAGVWLDERTYASAAAGGEELARAINALAPADVQRVAARLFLNTPVASVAVGDVSLLRADLARVGGVEVLGAPEPPSQSKPPQPKQSQPTLQLKRP